MHIGRCIRARVESTSGSAEAAWPPEADSANEVEFTPTPAKRSAPSENKLAEPANVNGYRGVRSVSYTHLDVYKRQV